MAATFVNRFVGSAVPTLVELKYVNALGKEYSAFARGTAFVQSTLFGNAANGLAGGLSFFTIRGNVRGFVGAVRSGDVVGGFDSGVSVAGDGANIALMLGASSKVFGVTSAISTGWTVGYTTIGNRGVVPLLDRNARYFGFSSWGQAGGDFLEYLKEDFGRASPSLGECWSCVPGYHLDH